MHQQHQVIIANLSNLEIPEIPEILGILGIPEIPEIPSFGILEISEAKPSPAVTFQLNQIMQFYNNNKINLGCIHIIIFNKVILFFAWSFFCHFGYFFAFICVQLVGFCNSSYVKPGFSKEYNSRFYFKA